jgi:hypothetical protein
MSDDFGAAIPAANDGIAVMNRVIRDSIVMLRVGWWAKETPAADVVCGVDAAAWKCQLGEGRSVYEERHQISCHSETAIRRVSHRDFTGVTSNIENDATRSNQMDDGVVRNGTNSSSEDRGSK